MCLGETTRMGSYLLIHKYKKVQTLSLEGVKRGPQARIPSFLGTLTASAPLSWDHQDSPIILFISISDGPYTKVQIPRSSPRLCKFPDFAPPFIFLLPSAFSGIHWSLSAKSFMLSKPSPSVAFTLLRTNNSECHVNGCHSPPLLVAVLARPHDFPSFPNDSSSWPAVIPSVLLTAFLVISRSM